MTSIVIRHIKNAKKEDLGLLVHRRHDLSGTDYERLGIVGMEIATKIGRDGIVVRSADVSHHAGVPGIVFSDGPRPYAECLDVRTDVSDETSTVKTILVDANISREMLGDRKSERIEWLYGEPASLDDD